LAFDLTEKRYIKETAVEARIARIIEPVANDLGYSLVRVRTTQENGLTLQIMAEDENGRFAITDCEALSKEISPVLDVEDPIDREYHLEVSSPGIDRPLVRARDFVRYVGHEARIELTDLLDGRRRFRGFIKAVDGENITVTLPDVPKDTDPDYTLPLRLLAEAKLVMTDKLMNMAQVDQEEFPIDDDDEIETVELADDGMLDDDPEAASAGDPADHKTSDSEQETN
jgi:ribosome maturation factor RimP